MDRSFMGWCGTDLQSKLEGGFYSLFYLSKALITEKINRNIRLLYMFKAPEGKTDPANAAVSGFAKSIHLENPGLQYKVIQLDNATPQEMIMVARNEFQNWSRPVEIRYQQGERRIEKLVEVQTRKQPEPVKLRERGVYLITGGMGGLGRIFGEYMAGLTGGTLVLTGRSERKADWERQLEKLRAKGATVEYIKADLAKPEAVRELIGAIKSRYGPINGVIHSAGITRDGLVLKKNTSDIEEVLAPKVYGTVYLDEFSKEEPLDFFVLFSSVSGELGNIGQSDYAYANSFMDHYVRNRTGQGRPGKTVTINWPLWRDGGMKVDAATEKWMREDQGIIPLTREKGLKAFEAALVMDQVQIMVLAGDTAKLNRIIHEINQPENPALKVTAETGSIDTTQLAEKTEKYLKDMLAREIKLPAARIQSNEPLENYGIDSVMVMNLTRELERRFGELSKTLFFEYQTIRELAGYFVENHRGQLLEQTGEAKGWNSKERHLRSGEPESSKPDPVHGCRRPGSGPGRYCHYRAWRPLSPGRKHGGILGKSKER